MDDAVPIPIGRDVPVLPATPARAPRFYNQLLEALSDLGVGVAVLEADRFIYANEALATMVARPLATITSDAFSVRALFAPESREMMEEKLQERITGRTNEDHYDGILARPDGSRVHVEISVKPLRQDGRSLRYAVLRDVTERKRALEELEHARAATSRAEKMAALGSLVSGVAHEVRTPLVYLQNSAHTLRRRLDELSRGETTPETALRDATEALESIEEGVERIHSLVKDLHRYTRLPIGRFEPARLEDVAAEALRLWQDTHPGTATRIEAHLDETPSAYLDRAKIQQVVLNLLENSHDAMPGGGRIVLTTRALPEACQLVVTDEGTGIHTSEREHIFEPLYSTKPAGMGLGLDIVRRIVELHRGTIRCDSSPGHGTTFTVTLPARA